MAKQAGPFYFTGTIGDVIFYKSGEQYLVRMKGSYNTKALQKPGARPLMQLRQQEFGQASKLASWVRRQLPLARRKEVTIGSLTKEARKLLRQGKTGEEIKAVLLRKVAINEMVVSPTLEEPSTKEALALPTKKNKKLPISLSGWIVLEGGVLTKETTIEHTQCNIINKVCTECIKQGGCRPCVYKGLRYLQKE